MRAYDAQVPLIFIHVPKTAGPSVRDVFRSWFGPGLLEHYAGQDGAMPVRHDLAASSAAGRPLAIYGHFNRRRGFGIEHYYPEVTQFVTVLRDPFERAISGYLHLARCGHSSQAPVTPRQDLRSYLQQNRRGILDFLPSFVTANNYREMIERHFIELGVMEHLGESLKRIAKALRQSFHGHELPKLNVNPDPREDLTDLREQFVFNHSLDYEIYEYARSRFTVPGMCRSDRVSPA